MSVVITKAFFEEGKSKRGGWTHKQTDCLGIERPYKAGWRDRVIGTEVPYESAHKFLTLSNRFSGMSYAEIAQVLSKYCGAVPASNQSLTSCAPISGTYSQPREKKLSPRAQREMEQLLMRALASSGRLGDVMEAAELCRKVTFRIEEILKANHCLA